MGNAEEKGGKTIMGKTISGLTKAITKLQNPMLYGDKNETIFRTQFKSS